jgi:hypothetical protein
MNPTVRIFIKKKATDQQARRTQDKVDAMAKEKGLTAFPTRIGQNPRVLVIRDWPDGADPFSRLPHVLTVDVEVVVAATSSPPCFDS